MTNASLSRLFLVFLAFVVILYGAYVRLTDAGLGCPDWPGCYGKLVVSELDDPNFSFAPGTDYGKAYREMVHRYLAGILGLGIFGLFIHYWVNEGKELYSRLKQFSCRWYYFRRFWGY